MGPPEVRQVGRDHHRTTKCAAQGLQYSNDPATLLAMARTSPPTERVVATVSLLAARPDEPLSLAELTRRLGVNKSTGHAILTSLAAAGWVLRDPTRKTYRLGPALVALGRQAAASFPALDFARPALGRPQPRVRRHLRRARRGRRRGHRARPGRRPAGGATRVPGRRLVPVAAAARRGRPRVGLRRGARRLAGPGARRHPRPLRRRAGGHPRPRVRGGDRGDARRPRPRAGHARRRRVGARRPRPPRRRARHPRGVPRRHLEPDASTPSTW